MKPTIETEREENRRRLKCKNLTFNEFCTQAENINLKYTPVKGSVVTWIADAIGKVFTIAAFLIKWGTYLFLFGAAVLVSEAILKWAWANH